MERVLRLFQRDILAADMPAYYMYAGGKRRPRTRVILSAWSRGLVVHLRCKVKGISSVIPNYFGGVPWYSVLVPFFSATGARQTHQMAVTLHHATEIKNHAIAYTFIIRLMKTGIKAEKHRHASHHILRCLILPSYTCSTEHSKVSFQGPEKVSRTQALPKQPCPCGTRKFSKVEFPGRCLRRMI